MSDKIGNKYVERQVRDLAEGDIAFVVMAAVRVDYDGFAWADLNAHPAVSPYTVPCVLLTKEADGFKLILAEEHLKNSSWVRIEAPSGAGEANWVKVEHIAVSPA